MSSPDQLPEDQRTVLTLLVGRGMSYARAAAVLGVSPDAVRDRAHVALAMLAPSEAREIDDGLRAEVADYMLGQDDEEGLARAREAMEHSPAATAWAHSLAHALEPLSAAGSASTASATSAPADEPAAAEPAAEPPTSPKPAPEPAGDGDAPAPSSRRGGALLLGVLGAVLVVAVVLILVLTGGSKSSGKGGSHAASDGPQIAGKATLTSPSGAKTVGEVFILRKGTRTAYYIVAVGLPPTEGFFYALWLYNSQSDAKALNRAPEVKKNGHLAGGALLPADAHEFHEMVLTRETQSSPPPKEPGPIVLRGKLTFSH